MISLLAMGLVLSGAVILIGSLPLLRRLIGRLPAGTVRNRWYVLAGMVALFIAAYLGYAIAFWNRHASLPDLIVPGVFFLGAWFVLLSVALSLQTAIDVLRISVLERAAATDPLTGVFNRGYLDRRLKEEIASARRYRQPLSVFMLDIDHFKQINDTHGHLAGDQVLVTLAGLVAAELRETDVLTRYGGEEFLVVTPHTSLEGAALVAERVRNSIEAHRFDLPTAAGASGPIGITASIGVASLAAGEKDGGALIHAADVNLYQAKQAGRNRISTGAPGSRAPTARP